MTPLAVLGAQEPAAVAVVVAEVACVAQATDRCRPPAVAGTLTRKAQTTTADYRRPNPARRRTVVERASLPD